MRIAARITPEGGEEVLVTARPVDILQWELGNKRRITEGMGYGDLMQIVHTAAKREGHTDKPFTDWVATLTDFEPETTKPDPTQTDPPTD